MIVCKRGTDESSTVQIDSWPILIVGPCKSAMAGQLHCIVFPTFTRRMCALLCLAMWLPCWTNVRFFTRDCEAEELTWKRNRCQENERLGC